MTLAERLAGLPRPTETPAERLRQTFELFEEGVELQRGNLKRRHPAFSSEQVEALLRAWLARENEE